MINEKEEGEGGLMILYLLAAVLAAFLLYVLFLVICSLLVDPQREYESDSPFYRRVLLHATALAMRLLRIRVHVTGLEKIPADSPVLVVGNHRSNFDPIITWHVLKTMRLSFISKPENFHIPIFGRIIRRCCFLPIDRQDPRKAILTIRRAAERMREQAFSIGVYPEGTRSKNGKLLPFHNGVFKIAKQAQSPIVVAAISGTENIHRQTPFRTTHVYFDILEVIPSDTVQNTKTDQLGSHIRALLQQHLQEV